MLMNYEILRFYKLKKIRGVFENLKFQCAPQQFKKLQFSLKNLAKIQNFIVNYSFDTFLKCK